MKFTGSDGKGGIAIVYDDGGDNDGAGAGDRRHVDGTGADDYHGNGAKPRAGLVLTAECGHDNPWSRKPRS